MPEELKIGFYITVLLVGVLLYKKKKPQPTRLDLSGFKNRSKNQKRAVPGIRKVVAEVVAEAPDRKKSPIFFYEGKKHNALKVLGLPLGAGLQDLKKACAQKIKEDASSKNLYLKAYNSLSRK